ncbi:hypothetical protein BOX15_Mlig011475g1, partial [Macrostomum lignano]
AMRLALSELLQRCADGGYCQSAGFLRCAQRHPTLLEAPLHLLTASRVDALVDAVAKQLSDCGADSGTATDLAELLAYIHLFAPRPPAPAGADLDRVEAELARLRSAAEAAAGAGASAGAVAALRFAIRDSLLFLGLNGRQICKRQWRLDAPSATDFAQNCAALIDEQNARFKELRHAKNSESVSADEARFWGESDLEADDPVGDAAAALEPAPAQMSKKKIARLARRLGRCAARLVNAADLADFCRDSLRLLAEPGRVLRAGLDADAVAAWRRAFDVSVTRALPLLQAAEAPEQALDATLACLEFWRRLLDRRRCQTDGWFGVPALQCALQCLLCLPDWNSAAVASPCSRLRLIAATARFVVKSVSRFREYLYASPAALLALLTRQVVAFVDCIDATSQPAASSEELRLSLSELSKAAQSFCSGEHRKQLAKTAWPLLAAYANRLHSGSAIDTRWRQELDAAVAAPFLAVTDRHAHSHLRVGLKPGPREILRNLHAAYLKYYKFHGDV